MFSLSLLLCLLFSLRLTRLNLPQLILQSILAVKHSTLQGIIRSNPLIKACHHISRDILLTTVLLDNTSVLLHNSIPAVKRRTCTNTQKTVHFSQVLTDSSLVTTVQQSVEILLTHVQLQSLPVHRSGIGDLSSLGLFSCLARNRLTIHINLCTYRISLLVISGYRSRYTVCVILRMLKQHTLVV